MNKISFLLSAILLISSALANPCAPDQILVGSNCIRCVDISHAMQDQVGRPLFHNGCLCEEGYSWDQKNLGCQLKQDELLKNEKQDGRQDELQENGFSSERLLQTTSCDTAKGFISYQIKYLTSRPSICFNCRLIPGSLGTARDQQSCGCSKSGDYLASTSTTDWNNCYTYSKSIFYFNVELQRGLHCSTLPTTALQTSCLQQKNPFFGVRLGKIYCPNVKNSVNNSSGSTCTCATGYRFSWNTARCECNRGYFRNAAGNCVICPSNEASMCSTSNCKLKYISDGQQCVLGSLLGIVATTGACSANRTLKNNPYDSRIIGCACSLAAGFFLNGIQCSPCSNIATLYPTAGITSSRCSSCNSTKMARTTVECVYCPNVANNLDGTSTINGCKCKDNYFWNTNTAKCECDYANGMILIGTQCLDCKNVVGQGMILEFPYTACSCRAGFVWDASSKTCNCSSSNSQSFVSGTTCVNCMSLIGANGRVSGSNACNCNKGLIWNAPTLKCICDARQNFVLVNSICTLCSNIQNSNGLANLFGCVCLNGFRWNDKACVPCQTGLEVHSNGLCVVCSAITNATLKTACSNCSNSAGYANKSKVCYDCIKQYGVKVATVTNNSCTCASNMRWLPEFGGCVCKGYSTDGQVWTYNSSLTGSNKWTCQNWGLTGTKSCGSESPTRYISEFKLCHLCRFDPNSAFAFNSSQKDYCKCRPGFVLNLVRMPFGCVKGCNFADNRYVTGTSCNNCSSLASSGTPSRDNCLGCSSAGGFIQVIHPNQLVECIHCGTLLGGGTTGAALQNGCVCSTGKTWNPIQIKCQ